MRSGCWATIFIVLFVQTIVSGTVIHLLTRIMRNLEVLLRPSNVICTCTTFQFNFQFGIVGVCRDFLSYPVTTTVDITPNTALEFPSVALSLDSTTTLSYDQNKTQ